MRARESFFVVLRRRNKRTVATRIHDTAAMYQILRKLGDNLRVFGYLQNFGGHAVLQVDAIRCSMQGGGIVSSQKMEYNARQPRKH